MAGPAPGAPRLTSAAIDAVGGDPTARALIQAGGNVGVAAVFATYAALSATTAAANAGAIVIDADTGTHTDPVVGGTVANAGIYRYSTSPAGWQRVGTSLATLAGQLSSSIDISDLVSKLVLFAIASVEGYAPLTVEPDGTVEITQFRNETLDGLTALLSSLVLRTPMGGEGGRLVGSDTASGAGLLWALVDAAGAILAALNDDGTFELDSLVAAIADVQLLTTPRLALRSNLGAAAGSVEYGDATDLSAGIADASGLLPMSVNPDGSLDAILDDAARYGGAAFVAADVVLEARAYAYNRRHVWAYWSDTSPHPGLTVRLTTDNTADHAVFGYDPASQRALIAKRVGDRITRYGVSAAIGGGALNPVVSSRDIYLLGDSFVSATLLADIQASMADKGRAFAFSGSGGSWLTAHLAALAGPADPINAGVVPASQVGSYPMRNGGAAQTSAVGSISGNVLTVTSATGAAVQPGQQLIVPTGSLTVGTPPIVQAFGSGGTTGTGGAGTYQLNVAPGNVADGTAIYLGPWTYPGVPQFLGATLVIMDGGLDDIGDGIDAVVARIKAMGQVLTPIAKRWFYVQCGINRTSTPSAVSSKLATDAAIQAAIGYHFLPTYAWMQAHGTGSTTGSGGGSVWAADNYGDDLHPSDPGKVNLAACIAAYIEALGN